MVTSVLEKPERKANTGKRGLETRLITSPLLVGEGEIGGCQKYELRQVACSARSPHLHTPPHLHRWPGG